MKAIIISAGQGSRLLPLTLEMPKCLVHVGGRAILDHQLAALDDAGISEVVVVGGYRYEQLEAHVAAVARPGLSLVRNPFWAVGSSIGSVWAARACLAEPFLLMNGDTIFDTRVVSQALAAAAPGVNLVVERLGAAEADDMLVAIDGVRVLGVAKTLGTESATHRSLGIVVSTASDSVYAAALDEVIGEPGGTNAYHHDIIDRLARRGAVTPIVNATSSWQEIDRPEDIDRWTIAQATRGNAAR